MSLRNVPLESLTKTELALVLLLRDIYVSVNHNRKRISFEKKEAKSGKRRPFIAVVLSRIESIMRIARSSNNRATSMDLLRGLVLLHENQWYSIPYPILSCMG